MDQQKIATVLSTISAKLAEARAEKGRAKDLKLDALAAYVEGITTGFSDAA